MDELPVYGEEPDAPATPVGIREVFNITWELAVLGAIVGLVAGASSPYLKLLLIPIALPAWSLLRRLYDMLRRIFTA